jgi:hypothetical protein
MSLRISVSKGAVGLSLLILAGVVGVANAADADQSSVKASPLRSPLRLPLRFEFSYYKAGINHLIKDARRTNRDWNPDYVPGRHRQWINKMKEHEIADLTFRKPCVVKLYESLNAIEHAVATDPAITQYVSSAQAPAPITTLIRVHAQYIETLWHLYPDQYRINLEAYSSDGSVTLINSLEMPVDLSQNPSCTTEKSWLYDLFRPTARAHVTKVATGRGNQ